MSVDPEISVIVVSYNTRDMTLACLRSIVAETEAVPYETIVFENGSKDGSLEAIKAALPTLTNTRLVHCKGNLGFARANNVAIQEARGRYLLLLNPDTVVLDRAVEKLHQFALDNPEARIWGGRTIFADGSLNATNCYRQVSLRQLVFRCIGLANLFPGSDYFNGEVYGGWQRDIEREVEIVTGCFLMIEREFWDELDGFDPVFFMFGEETDLCMRARKLGARPRFTPSAQIIHHGGASQTIRAERMIRVMAAKMTIIRRHMQGFEGSVASWFLLLWPWSRMIAHRVAGWGKARQSVGGDAWAKVWSSRAEWRNGFPDHPSSGQGDRTKHAESTRREMK